MVRNTDELVQWRRVEQRIWPFWNAFQGEERIESVWIILPVKAGARRGAIGHSESSVELALGDNGCGAALKRFCDTMKPESKLMSAGLLRSRGESWMGGFHQHRKDVQVESTIAASYEDDGG